MTNRSDDQDRIARLWRWITTPPQAYVAYVVLLLSVWMVSFYAGTLNPRRGPGYGAQHVAPQMSVPAK